MKLEEFEDATIHFHNDADGCASAALVCKKLSQFTLACHDNPSIREIGKGKHLFLDLGGIKAEQVRGKEVTVIDHHLTDRLPCTHINPRFIGESYPTSYAVWKLFGDVETAWIAGVGIIGDKGVLKSKPLFELLQGKQPGLVADEMGQSEMYHSKLGQITQLVDSCSSALGEKGGIINVKALISLEPEEILNGERIAAKMVNAKKRIESEIERVLKKRPQRRGRLILLEFESDWSIKSAIANELLSRNPDKIVAIAQRGDGWVRVSLRGEGENLAKLAKEATEGIGSGGGHPEAAGLSVPAKHWDEFINRLEEELK